MVLTLYAGLEEAVPQESGPKVKKKDTRDVRTLENIGKNRQDTRGQEGKIIKIPEISFSRGQEKFETCSNKKIWAFGLRGSSGRKPRSGGMKRSLLR